MSHEVKLSRRQARENAFLAAFSLTFHPEEQAQALESLTEDGDVALDAFARQLLSDVTTHRQELDALIEAHLKGWTLARIPRPSIVAMRIALAEMLYGEERKPGVAINEAVELIKKYGAEGDHQFVNGLLGTVAREQQSAETNTAENSGTPC